MCNVNRTVIAIVALVYSFAVFAAERQVVVAESGGDFATIQEALASIEPTANNPYVIDVMPGRYYLANVALKSYVHIRGAGNNVTKLYSYNIPARNAFVLNNLTDVKISDVKIYNTGGPSGGPFGYGLYITDSSSVTISDSIFEGLYQAIYIDGGEKLTIENSVFSTCTQCLIYRNAAPVIRDNQFINANWSSINGVGSGVISGNTIADSGEGIIVYPAEGDTNPVTVIGNTIKGNAGNAITVKNSYATYGGVTVKDNVIANNGGYGVYVSRSSKLMIMHNRITGNGTDIGLSQSTANASFNVFDTVTGGGVLKGGYNLNSNGDPAPAL
jgi:parallel beta-helix repeat protein